jgi:8-oxo-dGTP pyrophosphatase MutT (NUDIX family)
LSAFTWPPEAAAGSAARPAPAEPVVAAVLIALFRAPSTDEVIVVLTRRRADLRSHAGEISFPGGRRDAEDADLSDTALREAEEEIGLPRAEVQMIGSLRPTSTFVTNYEIHPFIAMIPAGLAWTLSPREVEAVLELPLEQLRAAKTRSQIERRGITFETDTFVLGEDLIWGATARILENLLDGIDRDDAPEALRALRSAGHRLSA